MGDYDNVKDIVGKSLFILSVLMLIYLITSPLTHLLIHVDEYFTVTYMNFSFWDVITVISHDFHPPLYFLLGKTAVDFFNLLGLNFDTLFILKLVSIIPYALILIISFVKIKKDYGWLSAGLFSFAMFAASDFFIHYFIARMYSWGALFLLLSFLSFKEVITNFDKKSLALLSIFSACCVYTQYIMGLSLLVLYGMFLVYILLFEEKDKLKYWLISVFAAIILYVPWMPSVFSQVSSVSQGYWIPDLTLETAMHLFSNYMHSDVVLSLLSNGVFSQFSNKLIFGFFALFIFIIFIIIYYWESIDFDDKTSFYIVSGFAIYAGTIVIGVVISILFQPILVSRYLLPATAVLWLSISILINKIKNKKLFIIYSILIVIILVSGVSDAISDANIYYDTATTEQVLFNQIAQDENSVVITNSAPMFLLFSDQWDIYCTGIWLHGLTMDRAHEIYDFKNLDKNDTMNFIKNNSDKNIYCAVWGDPELGENITKIPMLHIPQWNIYKVSSEPLNKNDYYKYDNGTLEDHNDIWTYLKNPTLTRNSECTSITDGNGNGYIQIEVLDNYKIEFDMKQYGSMDYWNNEFYNISSSLTGFSLANFNAQPETWYHVEITIANGTINETMNNATITQTFENPTHFLFSVNNNIPEIQFKNFKARPI